MKVKPLYILFAWLLAAIVGRKLTDAARERLSKR